MAPAINSQKDSQALSPTTSPQETKDVGVFGGLVGNHKDFLEGTANDKYEYAKYYPTYPEVKWEPLKEIEVVDRGHDADPKKQSLLQAATKVDHLTPLIGTEISGIDLRHLTNQQKNDLALLVAERGVVFFRNQDISLEEQIELSHYYGPGYKHPSSGFPKGFDEAHVIYTDAKMRLDSAGFAKRGLWHCDVPFELNPPGLTILKLFMVPPVGADTMWGSCTGLYSSLSPNYQAYLDKLQIIQSGEGQTKGAIAMGWPIRRDSIDTIHPLVRVHPVTGWKSIFANGAFTNRIIGVPKSESDATLSFLFREMAENPELHVRYRWTKNDVAIWDNRTVFHSLIANSGDHVRHGLRVMPHAERPLSVAAYEEKFKKVAQDRKGRFEVAREDFTLGTIEKVTSEGENGDGEREDATRKVDVEKVDATKEEAEKSKSQRETSDTTPVTTQPQRAKSNRHSWKLSDRKLPNWIRAGKGKAEEDGKLEK